MNHLPDTTKLLTTYFQDADRQLVLETGETLLREGSRNTRLFLILEGTLSCSLREEDGKQLEVMQCSKGMFLGVYSFFSEQHITYLTIVALSKVRVAWIEYEAELASSKDFAADFLPVMVHELYLRQKLARKLSRDRSVVRKRLFESEKMVLLGQLASGLAHELNNAIGILERNTQWLSEQIPQKLVPKEYTEYFSHILEKGQFLSTTELRSRRSMISEKFRVPDSVARILAKTNFSDEQIAKLLLQGNQQVETIELITETALVLHDMHVAAHHATHVVRSVRDLGRSTKANPVPISIKDTIIDALSLTKNLTKTISFRLDIDSETQVLGNPGDLVQVWSNLIKNAAENLINAKIANPCIEIKVVQYAGEVCITLSDNGTGIPDELKSKIFQPNFTTKVSGLSFGLGLGLSIVKRILEEYAGSINLQSEPGKTIFTIKLPKLP